MPETVPSVENRRVLVIDDTRSIHDDFDKILRHPNPSSDELGLGELGAILFDEEESERDPEPDSAIEFEVEHAFQGEDGLSLVQEASDRGNPYALAFVDMRMPPGIDGLETIERAWKIDPRLQMVICSAHSDHTWQEIVARLGRSDQLLILKKPFDHAEVYQMAAALSEKWNAEKRTRLLTRNLEKKVEERTESLNQLNRQLKKLNSELEAALNEAECAVRAKGRFLATMSHEIRTTLNGIMGASYMLSDSELPIKEKEYADIIQTSSESLMTIINDILDYSKFESGQLELDSVSFSINELIEDCVTLLKPLTEQNCVEFSLHLPSDLPPRVIGDPTRLRQIFLNLLNNAIKFSKNASVDFRVACQRLDDGTAHFEFVFHDTGIGMDQDTVTRLFSAFMQADSSTTRRFGGTGLGLAICKLLANAMQADINVESEPAKGSIFTLDIALPIDSSPQTSDQPSREPRPKTVALPELEDKRVLLVDDNQINRKLGLQFLKRLGLSADVASNGAEAVKIFQSKTYDLILMDLQMPQLSGTGATRKIREMESKSGPNCPSTPIIALTANAFAEVRDECLSAGMDDFLTKPIRMTELRASLEKWLSPINN